MESILTSIKKLLGIEEDYTQYDSDIVIAINSVFGILQQLGIGPINGFKIETSETTWNDYIGDDIRLEMVKSYIWYKVRLMFDPPQNSALTSVIEKQIAELEWRMTVTVNLEENKNE